MSRRAFLALGSNLGDRMQYVRDAIARLSAAQGVNFLRASRVYETEPIGITGQPRFLNLVIEVELADNIGPRELLALVKRTETELGRTARERWGPREIDIDVLLVGEERVAEGDLELPHPRMWERAFVMVPLAELAPQLRGPRGESAAEIAARLAKEQAIYAQLQL
jgi:2-amino-4-hydroxy-6-hydroxymethyldihydropteridine diphosphokinase